MNSATTPLLNRNRRTELVTIDRNTGWWLLAAAAVGFTASWQLTVDKLHLLADPAFTPACSISELINCRSVMQSTHSTLFGFPNSLIGIAAFSCLIAVAISILARARFQSWYLWGLLAGTIAGTVFIHWLVYIAAFVIGALCLYCAAVWVATLCALGAVTSACITYVLKDAQPSKSSALLTFPFDWMPVLIATWIGAIAIVVSIGLVS